MHAAAVYTAGTVLQSLGVLCKSSLHYNIHSSSLAPIKLAILVRYVLQLLLAIPAVIACMCREVVKHTGMEHQTCIHVQGMCQVCPEDLSVMPRRFVKYAHGICQICMHVQGVCQTCPARREMRTCCLHSCKSKTSCMFTGTSLHLLPSLVMQVQDFLRVHKAVLTTPTQLCTLTSRLTHSQRLADPIFHRRGVP